MAISTDQYSIKALFEQKQTFVVPKYQRGYAWDDEAVDDFIRDISECPERAESRFRKTPFLRWCSDNQARGQRFNPRQLRNH